MRLALLVTCVVDVLAPDVGFATVRLLEASGCRVDVPDGQTCCGQPAWNAGQVEAAADVATPTLSALEAALGEGAEAVVVPAGSCATMVRIYWPELFGLAGRPDDAERARRVGAATFELTEVLAERPLPPLQVPPSRVAYHHSCHMLRELHVHQQPLSLLARIDGCEQVPWSADERCCGFGGLFSVKLPETSVAMADDKLSSLAESGAEVLVGADSSCLLHLRTRAEHEGRELRTCHVAELLAAALERRAP